MTLFTIGHSNHPWEKFVSLLRTAEIQTVADVRSYPRSRMAQFNQVPFRKGLERLGIDYLSFGEALGGRSKIYDNLDYARIARSDSFVRALEAVIQIGQTTRTALLCSEHEPLSCHRCLLIGRQLGERRVEVVHILRDGTLEPHKVTESRLLAVQKRKIEAQAGISGERLSMAYRLQEESLR